LRLAPEIASLLGLDLTAPQCCLIVIKVVHYERDFSMPCPSASAMM
jgi:hypothetical protein